MSGSSIISQPLVTIAIEGAQGTVSNAPQKVLVTAAFDPANGTAASGALTQNVAIDNATINALFGPRSQAAGACRSFRKINQVTQLDVIALDSTGESAATGVLTATGTATAGGTIQIVVGSSSDHTVDVTVISADTATEVGDAIEAAINADLTIPVVAVNSTGTVTLTAYDAGLTGNDIALRVIGGTAVPGITVVVTTAMTGGTGDIITSSTFDVVDGVRYQTVAYPGSSDLAELTGFLDPRFNADNEILDGAGIVTQDDTLSNLLATGNAENSQSLVVLGFNSVDETDYRGSSLLELELSTSAWLAGARSRRLTDGALTSDLLTGAIGLDAFGGPALASRPYANTPFSGLPIIDIGLGWIAFEIEQLLAAGISTIGANRTRTDAIAGEIVTTYKTDSAGNPDDSFNFLNKVDTSSGSREYIANNVKKQFAQTRLTSGALVEGRPMANEQSIRGFMMGLYRDLSSPDFALTVAGAAAEKVFAENMTVTLDLSLGRVTAVFAAVPMVSQFRDFLGTFRITFDIS